MSDKKRILIVGGVAGGASTAARARRLSEEAEIIMFERSGYISFANCGLPYHIGGQIKDRERLLVQTPESMRKRFNIDVRIQTEVTKINREEKSVKTKNLVTGEEKMESYDVLVLSPGAEPFKPPINGIENSLVLRNVEDMDAIIKSIDDKVKRPHRVERQRRGLKNAVVVGGGFIGLEMAEALKDRNIKVTLVELADQVMGPVDSEIASSLHSELVANGVDLRLGTSVTTFERVEDAQGRVGNSFPLKDSAGDVIKVELSTGEIIESDLAIMAIGVKPEIKLAKEANLEIGERGGIIVDEHMKTSDENIFAVGDAVEVKDFVGGFQTLIPLAGPANRQGRIAADNIFGRLTTYKNTQGTSICKVFNTAVAMTGMNEKSLNREKIPYEKIYIHPASHAGYYPGAHPMTLKLLFSPESGKIFGAQAVGADGIDKRIDVIATAIRSGLTVFDLEELELCYAPPFGSAKDPVNYAGFVAANIIKKDAAICHVEDVLNANENQVILDVRTEVEAETGKIKNSINIPVDDLRNRLTELSHEKEYLIYCAVGLRGYVACRILTQNGFNCRNLSGGFKTYKAVTHSVPKVESPLKEIKSDTGVEKQIVNKEKITIEVDACGLQCPGPIMKLKEAVESLNVGEIVSITCTDSGFIADSAAWCASTGNTLVSLENKQGKIHAVIAKGAKESSKPEMDEKNKTIVVFSGDFDKAMAAFIIANGAAAMGSKVTLFFTFWGLNVLRKDAQVPVKKNLIEKMFGMMMPRGAKKLKLSKMNMMGMGTSMMKGIMKKKNAASLPELIKEAQKAGVKLIACTMSMDMMGIKKEELIDGVEEGGVALYLNSAESGNFNLFI